MPGSTPVYGFPYPEPTDLVADYPALGQQLAEDIEATLPGIGGMASAAPTSIANSGGSASLSENTVTFTAVNAVSLNGCFTASYSNYRIVINQNSGGTGTNNIYMRLRVSGSDATTGYNSQNTFSYSTTVGAEGGSGTYFDLGGGLLSNRQLIVLDLGSPQLALATMLTGSQASDHGAVSFLTRQHAGRHSTATAYDGFTLAVTSSTISGTVSVYGYKK